MKYFVFDCETGGMPEKNTSLLTMNGSLLNSKLEIITTIDLKIKPEGGVYRVQARAMEVNGINLKEHDEVALSEDAAADEFINFLCRNNPVGDVIIPAGHNVGFDVTFMKKLVGAKRWRQHFSKKVIDTASIAEFLCLTGVLPASTKTDCSLSGLASRFDLPYDGAHDAEFDKLLTLEVLKKLVGLVSERKQ